MFDKKQIQTVSKEAFRIATALSFTIIAYQYFQIDRGYWGMLTILLIYSVPTTGLALRRAKDRVIGTVLGIIAAFIFAHIALIHSYKWAYLCFLFFIPAIFYLTIKDYYVIGSFFITLIVITGITVLTPLDANLKQLMAERLFYSFLAVAILFICEIVIFPKATQVGNKVDQLGHELTNFFVSLLLESKAMLDSRYDSHQLLIRSEQFILHYANIRDMYYSQVYELRYNQKENIKYHQFFYLIDRLLPLINTQLSLCRHCSKEELNSVIVESLTLEINVTSQLLEKAFSQFHSNRYLDSPKRLNTTEFSFENDENKNTQLLMGNMKKIQQLARQYS